jgi:FkbM family methyltransferase
MRKLDFLTPFLQFSGRSKVLVKFIVLRIVSQLHPKILNLFIGVFQQSSGYGFDSGLINETKQFSKEILKFNVVNPVILDVGANIGEWSLKIDSLIDGCIIHAFEPAAETFIVLSESTKKSPNIRVYNFGLGSKNGPQKLFYDEELSGKASLTKRNLKHINLEFDLSEHVAVKRLDTFLVENSVMPDFLKIDVEGHELAVLEGLGDYINNLKVIQFEFGGTDIDSRTFFQDFWQFFEEKQFDLFRLTPKGKIQVDSYRENDEVFSFTTYFAIAQRI